jgi:hypothetical protein
MAYLSPHLGVILPLANIADLGAGIGTRRDPSEFE